MYAEIWATSSAGSAQLLTQPLLTVLQALLQVCLLALVVERIDEADLLHLARLIACLGADAADVRCTQQLAALMLVCTRCCRVGSAFLLLTQQT
jgi:hypothetical protein